jgi:hypothetical protein
MAGTGGVQILTLAEQRRRDATMTNITVTERVYLDANGQATTDPEKGSTLWATPGREVPEEQAKAVGYKPPATKAQAKPKGGTKVVEGPDGDK